jgi:hypothetical protein
MHHTHTNNMTDACCCRGTMETRELCAVLDRMHQSSVQFTHPSVAGSPPPHSALDLMAPETRTVLPDFVVQQAHAPNSSVCFCV